MEKIDLPVPQAPATRMVRLRGKPPSMRSSKPWMPVVARSTIRAFTTERKA